MEEIIQILIFVGAMVIAVVGQNAKNKKKPATVNPEEVLEDAFPHIESPTPLAEEVRPLRRASRKSSVPPRTPMQEPDKSTPSPAPRKTDRIRLNTRSEARRAFIHSEIFNRKY